MGAIGTLVYNYYRTYDPSTGRYLESDPIGLAAGPNTYTYVDNMPTMYFDPFGLDKAENQRRANVMRGRHARQRNAMNQELNRTYQEMLTESIIGSDQFFHCLAACRAQKASGNADMVRERMKAKEYYRDYPMGRLGIGGNQAAKSHSEMMADIQADLAANEVGLQCPANVSCNKQCQPLILAMSAYPKSRNYLLGQYPP